MTSSAATERAAGGLCLVQILVPKLQPETLQSREGDRGRSCSSQQLLLQLLDTQEPLPARAMEGKADNQPSVVKLVAAFEEHW